ncbi:hypothetical protein DEO72_LG1g2642 [Vigna unguiculata]|uniref:Uncharacterized protein n=1 Tax=Vigna unguiculata TaxID=3917 RepID=A0A4D6KQY7_VIGUN|nr:hypothetical protein DEO72_LG1g2642 [Vigna unguiculata]
MKTSLHSAKSQVYKNNAVKPLAEKTNIIFTKAKPQVPSTLQAFKHLHQLPYTTNLAIDLNKAHLDWGEILNGLFSDMGSIHNLFVHINFPQVKTKEKEGGLQSSRRKCRSLLLQPIDVGFKLAHPPLSLFHVILATRTMYRTHSNITLPCHNNSTFGVVAEACSKRKMGPLPAKPGMNLVQKVGMVKGPTDDVLTWTIGPQPPSTRFPKASPDDKSTTSVSTTGPLVDIFEGEAGTTLANWRSHSRKLPNELNPLTSSALRTPFNTEGFGTRKDPFTQRRRQDNKPLRAEVKCRHQLGQPYLDKILKGVRGHLVENGGSDSSPGPQEQLTQAELQEEQPPYF